jgi:hypothetical protein
VPATVTVPAGARSTPFTATTSAVSANSSVTITAIMGSATKTVVISIVTEGISGFSTSTTSVRGGSRMIGKLEAHPGHDGFSVALTSPSPDVLGVPARVEFAPGELAKTFVITSSPVKTSTTVALSARVTATLTTKDFSTAQQITARQPLTQLGSLTSASSNGGISRTTSVTVTPPIVIDLKLSTGEVVGGSRTVITGTITLDAPAPADYFVRVASSSSVVGPESEFVRVLAGETTATFTARTLQVTNRQTVTVSANGQPSATGGFQRAMISVVPR